MGSIPTRDSFGMRQRVFDIVTNHEPLLRAAIERAIRVEVDELDCRKSFLRRKTDKTIEEVLQLGLNNGALFNFIERWCAQYGDIDYFDVGLSVTVDGVSYFLWIVVSIEDGESLISQFNLKEKEYC